MYHNGRKVKSITVHATRENDIGPNYGFQKNQGTLLKGYSELFYCNHLKQSHLIENEKGYNITIDLDSSEYKGIFAVSIHSKDLNNFFNDQWNGFYITGDSDDYSIIMGIDENDGEIRQYGKGRYSTCVLLVYSRPQSKQSICDTTEERMPNGNNVNLRETATTDSQQLEKKVANTILTNGKADLETKKNAPGIRIRIKSNNGEIIDYVVVKNVKDISQEKRFILYSETLARELLTSYLRKERNKKGTIDGFDYVVLSATYGNGRKVFNARDIVFNNSLIIRTGGGTISSSNNANEEIVEMLLYSPFTGRFELIMATHNKKTDVYYTSPSRFREFVKRFGNPGIKIKFFLNGHVVSSISNDNAEAFFEMYGYSLRNEYCTENTRHMLLAEIVDLGILTPGQVKDNIIHCLMTYSSEDLSSARLRGQSDIRFIDNYKVDPDRFSIQQ